jgi:hypothetical protein
MANMRSALKTFFGTSWQDTRTYGPTFRSVVATLESLPNEENVKVAAIIRWPLRVLSSDALGPVPPDPQKI